jgi:hypothetical protein
MQKIELIKISHNFKIGDKCPATKPNVTEDVLLLENGEPIGFFIKKIPERMAKIADLANYELRSDRVPKVRMSRLQARGYDKNGKSMADMDVVSQFSTIIGSVRPKPLARRPYPTISSVHNCKTAQNFIKSMLMLVNEAENMIADIMPNQYKTQLEIFKNVDDKWKFGKLFTSSISNYNINADYHIDKPNIKNTVNVIITKRLNSEGGNLNVPDYNATFDQCDNSILVYPAWKSLHGVTPIIEKFAKGYRNSLVFYPLNDFLNKSND